MAKTKKTEDELLKDIFSRFSQLEYNRNRFKDRWEEAQRYVAPTVYNWEDLDAIPEIPKRYSSAPCNYLATLQSGLVGYSISPNIQWYKLSLENPKLLALYGVKDWLEEVEDVMNAEFNRSNLYKQAAPWINNAATIGHGVMLIEDNVKDGTLLFTTQRCNEIYLDVNSKGEIDTVFRKYLMTVRNAVEFFGLDKLDDTVKAQYEEVSQWNNKIEILFCVMPREDYNPNMPDNKNMPYAAIYIDKSHNKLIEESGFTEMPYSIFEWDQIPGLAYSNSPAINALPDIKFLNIATKTSEEIAQTSAEPPMKVSAEVREINILPRGMTYLPNANSILEPVKTGENYPITIQITQQIEQRVKDWFNVDFFLMLQQKQGKMTATEVMELQGEKSAVLSNLIVNLNSALSKIIERSFNLLMNAGRLPLPPQTLSGTNTAMKIDFMGPLAVAQKKYHTAGGIASAMQLAGGIMQLFPNSGDFIDADELVKRAMEGQGMPQAVIREDDDVQKLREQRVKAQQQAQAQAQQQQMLQSVMQNANKLGEMPEQGSVMQQLNEQLKGGMSYE